MRFTVIDKKIKEKEFYSIVKEQCFLCVSIFQVHNIIACKVVQKICLWQFCEQNPLFFTLDKKIKEKERIFVVS